MSHVAVIGAGPTGLTAALELRRLGAEVTIIDRRDAASGFSRAVGISARSMDIFGPSGVADAIAQEAVRFSGILFHLGPRPIARLPLNFDDRARLWGLAQDRTEHHLATALRALGTQVRYGTACMGLAQDAGGVTVQTGTGTVRADHVIGADGVHSTVRQALGLDFPGYDLPDTWSIADVDVADWPDADAFHGYLLDRGKVVVVVPMAPRRMRVISSAPDALAALPVPMHVTRLNRAGTFAIPVRQVRQYAQGRVLLAGDAAHCHSPVGGRGMNLGIADAAEAARRIMDGTTAGYHAARHAEGARVLAFSERGRRLLQSRNPAVRAGLVAALATLDAVPPLARAAIHRLVGD